MTKTKRLGGAVAFRMHALRGWLRTAADTGTSDASCGPDVAFRRYCILTAGQAVDGRRAVERCVPVLWAVDSKRSRLRMT